MLLVMVLVIKVGARADLGHVTTIATAAVLKTNTSWSSRDCCAEVAYADCWGFHDGGDSTASIQVCLNNPS